MITCLASHQEETMPLDPQAQAFLDQVKAMGLPPFEEMTVEQARNAILAGC